jgi:hypothetical protein
MEPNEGLRKKLLPTAKIVKIQQKLAVIAGLWIIAFFKFNFFQYSPDEI